jgi:integrase
MAREIKLPSGLPAFQGTAGSGKDRQRKNFKTMVEAEAWEAKENPLAPPKRPEATTPATPVAGGSLWTLQQAYDRTFAAKWKSGESQRTLNSHWNFISAFFGAGTLCEAVIQGTWIDEFRTHQMEVVGNSPVTVNRKVITLSTMLHYCQEVGGLSRLPRFRLHKETAEERWYSDAEEEMILAKCLDLGFPELHDFVILALDLGFRRGELLPLTLAQCINGKFLLQAATTKGKTFRSVTCSDRVMDIVRKRISAGEPRMCGRLTVDIIEDQWDAVRTSLGMSDDPMFKPHTLRHTYATRLVEANVPLPVVQKMMGHKSPKTTMRYAHVSDKQADEAANALQARNRAAKAQLACATPPQI